MDWREETIREEKMVIIIILVLAMVMFSCGLISESCSGLVLSGWWQEGRLGLTAVTAWKARPGEEEEEETGWTTLTDHYHPAFALSNENHLMIASSGRGQSSV